MTEANKIFITLAEDYVPNWGFWQSVREFLANGLDTGTMEYEHFNNQGDRWVSIKSFGGAIPKEMLMMGKSGKRDDTNTIGQHGEGSLLAMLVLTRMGYDLRIKNGLDKWLITIELHPQLETPCLCVEIKEGYYELESDEVDITILGVTEEDVQILEKNYVDPSFFRYLPEEDIVVDYEGCQIFRYSSDCYPGDRASLCDEGNPKKVFVNGLFVCDLPDNYVFSYNLTPDKISLDRDRQSVNTWDMQREVASLLEDACAFDLMVTMSEEKVPDLYEYYTPSHYRRVSGSYSSDTTETVSGVLQKLSAKKFVEKHGDKAIAVSLQQSQNKRDILKNRIKLSGKVAVEVPETHFKLLPKELTTVPETTSQCNVKPSTLVQQFFETNKKHMRSKAKKQMEKLIEDLILTQ